MMELLWYSYAFSGRGEHETSLLEPVPPGETLYLTKKPPDTTRIIPAFLRDSDTYLIAMLRDPRAVVTSRHRNRPDVYFASFQRWRAYAAAIKHLAEHPRCSVIRLRVPDHRAGCCAIGHRSLAAVPGPAAAPLRSTPRTPPCRPWPKPRSTARDPSTPPV